MLPHNSFDHYWKKWPLWTGPVIMVGSPFIVIAIHIPFLLCMPCVTVVEERERRQQRATQEANRMEEARRSNQIYIDRMASAGTAHPAAPAVAHPEEERRRDGEDVETALSPTNIDDAQKENDHHSDHRPTSKEAPITAVAEHEIEKQDTEKSVKEAPVPSVNEHGNTSIAITPPAPAHLGQSPWALELDSDLRAIKS
jgi:hypothetical protein